MFTAHSRRKWPWFCESRAKHPVSLWDGLVRRFGGVDTAISGESVSDHARAGAALAVTAAAFFAIGVSVVSCEFFAWEYAHIRPEIVPIPAGFEGKARIYFSDPGGVPEETERGKLVLRIGANGELRTRRFSNYSVNAGCDERREYFFLEPPGRRVRPFVLSVNDGRDRGGVIPGAALRREARSRADAETKRLRSGEPNKRWRLELAGFFCWLGAAIPVRVTH